MDLEVRVFDDLELEARLVSLIKGDGRVNDLHSLELRHCGC
jgi:hypothetical protein